jgi:serine/threonine protein phosphatase PrpC
MKKYFSYKTNNIGKKQDYVNVGSYSAREINEESFDWIVLADAHGVKNTILDIVSSIDYKTVVTYSSDLVKILINDVNAVNNKSEKSGCTFIFVKIFNNRIVCESIGDSTCVVFIDDVKVFENEKHNLSNEKEVKRLKTRKIRVTPSTNEAVILSSDEILFSNKMMDYYVFENNLTVATTQALGHNGITGYEPEKSVIYYSERQRVRVIVCSDGFWDMIIKNEKYVDAEILQNETNDLMNMNIEELSDKVINRWNQTWKCYCEKNGEKCEEIMYCDSYNNEDWDDSAIAVWDNYSGKY